MQIDIIDPGRCYAELDVSRYFWFSGYQGLLM